MKVIRLFYDTETNPNKGYLWRNGYRINLYKWTKEDREDMSKYSQDGNHMFLNRNEKDN